MRGKMLIIATVVVFTLAGCAAPEPAAEEPAAPAEPAVDVEAEAQAIRDLSAQWLVAAQARDAAAIAPFFADDGVTLYDGEMIAGPAAIQANAEAEFAEAPESTITWTTAEVHVAESGDLAYERGSWTFDPDGEGAAPAEHGEYVTVWEKTGGEWKVAVDAGTTLEAGDEG